MNNHSEQGSLWHQWDLHLHSPSSLSDYENNAVTNKHIVDTLVDNGVRVVAITDHHTIDVKRIRELQTLGAGKLIILPGIEFRSDQGGDPIHYISIFPEDCNLEHVWDTLRGSLNLTEQAIKNKGGDQCVYIPIEKGAAATRDLGGVVSIHAGKKSNSIEGIKNNEQFQRKIKEDLVSDWIDILEIGQIKDIDMHHKTIFPAAKLIRPLVICSDNHDITKYERKVKCWLKADPTFRGLLMVLKEPTQRVYIGEAPPELQRIKANSTKYIQRISFQRSSNAPDKQKWFSGDIHFNPGLIAIIGNKGSGKSALSDTLGLLGATKNFGSFSFLSKQRFNHGTAGFAEHFNAEIEWRSGETESLNLAKSAPPEKPERLKYLPQDHVEKICNELDGVGESIFERELKSVIFSHIPNESRLSQKNLDDLFQFRSAEKQQRIDTLLKQLRDVSRNRAVIEKESNPKRKAELEEEIKRKRLEIEAHNKAKPEEPVTVPSTEGTAINSNNELSKHLKSAEANRGKVVDSIANATNQIKEAERKKALAARLLERLQNYEKEYKTFILLISNDTEELKLEPRELVIIEVKMDEIVKIRDNAMNSIEEARSMIGEDEDRGLQLELREVNQEISKIHAKLDAPNRAYQNFLKNKADWEDRQAKLMGDSDSPDTLEGLKAVLANFESIPSKIEELKKKQIEISKEILSQKQEQAKILSDLYGPVQSFIDSHPIAKDKLQLKFKVELTEQEFSSNFLNHIDQNRKGSFRGTDEGKAKALSLVEHVNWADSLSVEQFLDSIDMHLHEYQREDGVKKTVQLSDQLVKGHSAENLFTFLYGLEYVQPRYVLQWEEKEIAMLSPGERGTLLLVFYLLVDKGDLPLIIDQPEGNLDNHTVAKILVDCIRKARELRQVFIVTHNPNLAVVCDADQIIYAAIDKKDGNAITYTSGSLENPNMSQYITDVLEGTRWAFGVRGEKYKVGDTR